MKINTTVGIIVVLLLLILSIFDSKAQTSLPSSNIAIAALDKSLDSMTLWLNKSKDSIPILRDKKCQKLNQAIQKLPTNGGEDVRFNALNKLMTMHDYDEKKLNNLVFIIATRGSDFLVNFSKRKNQTEDMFVIPIEDIRRLNKKFYVLYDLMNIDFPVPCDQERTYQKLAKECNKLAGIE